MAAASPVASLREEATCPVCLEYFRDPVITACGHNFCRACLRRCGERPGPAPACPQCREPVQQGALRPNRQLANVVELVKQLSLPAAQDAGGAGVCGEHRGAVQLFCEEDQAPIGQVCREVPVEEAAQEYTEKFEARLKTLREEREKLLGWKATAEERSQEYLKQTQAERQKVVAEFQQLRQFLEEQERLLLAQLEKLEEELVRLQTDAVRKVSAQISRLSELIGELERKSQKPASEFLQDARSTLSRCETGQFQLPEEISPELDKRVSGFSQKTFALSETLRKFKDTLPSALEGARGKSLGALRQEPDLLATSRAQHDASQQAGTKQPALALLTRSQPATLTLDPDTAHPQLVLSEDGKSVRWEQTRQPLPDTPERFDTKLCVLGCEGFTAGRHSWEVEVGGGGYWAVGVARESVSRKGEISLSPEGGVWAVGYVLSQFWALTSPKETLLTLSRAPSRARVCLDCDQGQVTFIDAADDTPIFTFPPGSLPGERIRPWLWVGRRAWLSLCP